MDENTTDALNNLISSIKEKMNESNTNLSNTLNETADNKTQTSSTNINVNLENNSENNTNNNNSSFDPELFIKIQKIMGAMNGNNPKKNLLLSLKPFLRQTRQNKINEYINILNIISALDSFKKGSDWYVSKLLSILLILKTKLLF